MGQKIVALNLELSHASIELFLSAMAAGQVVAIVPSREPASVIDAWLTELNLWAERQISQQASVIIRTSGSTAQPKSAQLSWSALRASARAVNNYVDFKSNSVWALSLPLFHVGGLAIVVRALEAQAMIEIAGDYDELVSLIKTDRVSHVSLVPAQVRRLLGDNIDLAKLRAVIIGGDSLAGSDREQALARDWPLCLSYGLTETASMIYGERYSSAGPKPSVLEHAQLRLAADGEILVKSASLLTGYIIGGELLKPFDSQGFFATGDMAQFNNNQLHIIGRKNNRIISGGENIQAEEIEQVLESHPLITMCVVVRIADAKFGERPLAFVKWRAEPLSEKTLVDFLTGKLARYKHPVKFIAWPDHLPHVGKKPRSYLKQHLHTLTTLS